MNDQSILGSYALRSFVIQKPDGETLAWGQGAHGLLIYTPTGHVSVSINKDIEDDSSQTDLENLFDSLLFYSGTYAVEGNLIRHQVSEASNPARIGKEMIRYAEWRGDELHLTTPKESFGQATLVWTKL